VFEAGCSADDAQKEQPMQDPYKPANPYNPSQVGSPSGYQAPGRGGLILTFGILGLVACAIFGICAWVMGKNDLAEMAAGRMDPTEHSLTNTGKILGMVSVILNVVIFGFIALMILVSLITAAAV